MPTYSIKLFPFFRFIILQLKLRRESHTMEYTVIINSSIIYATYSHVARGSSASGRQMQ